MDLHDALRKVRAMIAKAEDLEAKDPNDPEAMVARKFADKLMLDFRIEQSMLDASKPEAERMKPGVVRDITIAVKGNPARGWLIYLTERVAMHCGVKMIYHGLDYPQITLKASAHGYEGALGYFDVLYTSVYLHLGSTISPKWNEFQSEEWNIVELHKKGLNWLDIARLNPVQPGGKWDGDQRTAEKFGSRIKRIYFKWCKDTGNPRVSTGNRVQYIKNFARAYYYEIDRRLDKIEAGRDSGGALVLASDAAAVAAMIAEMYGELSESSKVGGLDTKFNADAWDAGSKAGREVDLSGSGKMNAPERTALQ